MRWPWSPHAAELPEPMPLEPLGATDLDRIEVVELDAAGTWVDQGRAPATDRMDEVAYGPARDGTGLAGIWEALVER